MIGEQILSYQIESLIGSGGVGSVFLASHTQLGRKVAIKVLNPNLVNHIEIRDRFRNEAATLSNLQHINIVTLYDYLENEKGLFLIMEYVKGKPLDEYISKVSGPIPEQKAVFYFKKILNGLSYAHNQGVVHRDIKPSNIIITDEGDVKLLDFGIAKILKANHNMTKTGTQIGTVLYMSPEQVKGDTIDQRSDVYSLGVTLFEMLTGKCPYDEQANTEFEIYNKILNDKLPRAKEIYPAVSDNLQDVIDKATHKDPNQRYQTCEEFRNALITATTVERKTTPVAPVTSETNLKTEKKKKKKSYILLYSIITVVIIGLATIIIMEMFSNKGKPLASNKLDVPPPPPVEDEDLTDEYNKNKKKVEEDTEEEKISPDQIKLDSLKTYRKYLQKTLENAINTRKATLLKGLVVDVQIADQSLGETTVRLKVSNTLEDAIFENVEVAVLFLDSQGEELKNYNKVYGSVNAQEHKEENITVEIDAERISGKLIEATPKSSQPFTMADSLGKVINKVQTRIVKLQNKLSDISTEKEEE